jgi:uncharacterized membrane protein YwaF
MFVVSHRRLHSKYVYVKRKPTLSKKFASVIAEFGPCQVVAMAVAIWSLLFTGFRGFSANAMPPT